MSKKKEFKILIVILICLFGVTGYAKKIGVIYTFDPVKIDGLITDWENVKLYQSNSGKTEYAFKIDNKNLYILFKFNDQKLLSTFFSNGMKIWLNRPDKKNHTYGINFMKKTLSPDQMVQLLEKKYGKIPEDKKKQIYAKKKYDIYQSVIIKEDKKQAVPVKFNSKEKCAFKINNTKEKKVIVEFKIPHVLQKQLLSIGELGEELRLDFEWGGMTKEMYEQQLKMRAAQGVKGSTYVDKVDGIQSDQNTVGYSQVRTRYARNIGPKKYSIKLVLVLPTDKIKK